MKNYIYKWFDLVNREFDFSIGMDTNLDTNELKPICWKNSKLQLCK